MRKNIVFYSIAILLVFSSFLFYYKAYNDMIRYSWLTNRTVVVHSTFQNLSRQLNSITASTPSETKDTALFKPFTLLSGDSASVAEEIEVLKNHVLDSVNTGVAAQLDTLIKSELSWLVRSNVPDSIKKGNSIGHLVKLRKIDSLLTRGLSRTSFLFKYRQARMKDSMSEVSWRIITFLGLAIILIVYALYGFFSQRSKRLAGEGQLKKQEYVFQTLIENNGDIIVLLDDKLNYVYRSASAERVTGHARSGSHVKTDEVHPEDRANVRRYLEEIIPLPNKVTQVTYRVKHKNGNYIWLEGTFMNKLKDPNIGAIVINVRDVTDRKKAEHDLEVREKRFHETLDNMMEGAQIIDFNWRYIYVNKALSEYSTYKSEDLLGSTIQEKYPGVEQSDLFKVLQKCMVDRVPSHLENEFVFPNGVRRFFELSVQPVPEGIFILSVDITERKKAELEIEKLNRLYAFISAVNQSIVHIRNQDDLLKKACEIAITIGKFRVAWIDLLDENNQLQLAYIEGEPGGMRSSVESGPIDYNNPLLKNTPVGRAYHSAQYAVSNDLLNDPLLEPLRGGISKHDVRSAISLPIKKFGKMVGLFNLSSTQVDFFDKQEIDLLLEAAGDLSFAMEIFDRNNQHKVTEDLVVQNEKRFRALIEKSTDMKTLTSVDGNFVYASPSVWKTFGYKENEVINKPAHEFFHPDDQITLARKRAAVLGEPGASFTFQFRLKHKNGTWIWCEGTLTNMLHEQAINALVSNFTDISERKAAEEQKEKLSKEREHMLSDLMTHSKNLEQFAYMVSHNLRSPVAQIMGISNILKGNLSDPERLKSQEFMYKAVERLDAVVKDLNKILEIRSGVAENKEEVIFSEILKDISIAIHDTIEKERVKIETDLQVGTIKSVKSYIYSIFYNFITNSIKYRSPGRKPVIKISSKKQGENIVITFSDNGLGLDLKKYGDKIFGLYARFHENIGGKGIGLFMVKTQIESMGGHISVTSALDEGTEFTVVLPEKPVRIAEEASV
ncbi:MAG: PAS domain S-box protein [Bacteroidia bacterium]|nr:PAS domain S-box protein [Bacteroidia bacterium]